MGIVKRQSLRSTVVSYTGVIAGFFNAIILYPRILTPDQYGLTELLISIAIIGAEFSMVGIPPIFLRYLPFYSSEEKELSGFLTFTLALPIAGFLVLTLLGFIFKDLIVSAFVENSGLFVEKFYFLIPLVFFLVLFQMFASYSTASMKTVVPIFLRDLFIKVYRSAIVLIFATGYISFQFFLYLLVGGYALQAILIFFYLLWLKKISFNFSLNLFFSPRAKEILFFGLFSLLGGTIMMFIGYIDTIMLGSLKGLSEAAVYRVAFYMANVIDVPARAILTISVPIVGAAWRVKDMAKIHEIYAKTALNQLIIGGLLFIGIWANIDNILSFLPQVFESGKYVVLFILLGKLFDLATGTNGSIIGLSKDYKFMLYLNLFLVVVAIIANLLLIPIYGIVGAAIATALSIFLHNAGKYFFVLYRFKLQPFSFSMIKCLLIIVISFIIGTVIPHFPNIYVDIAIRSLVILIVFSGSILFFKVSADINEIVDKIFRLLRIK